MGKSESGEPTAAAPRLLSLSLFLILKTVDTVSFDGGREREG